MAAGNMVGSITPVAAGASLDIRPPSGQEWIIHNIKYGGQVTLNDYDSTNTLQWDSDTGAGGRLGLTEHVSNSYWIRVTNTGSTTINISFNGMQTV